MPHRGGRQECERGEEAETMGKGFEKERKVGKVEELQRGWCGSRKSHRTSEGAWSDLDVKKQPDHGGLCKPDEEFRFYSEYRGKPLSDFKHSCWITSSLCFTMR